MNAAAKPQDELLSIGTKLGLPLATTDDLVNLIAADMLRSIYRYPGTRMDGDKEVEVPLTEDEHKLNARVEKVYQQWYNQDFPPYRRKIRATALFGPPGHGKTTAFEVAAKKVADAMGMRFLSPERLESVPIQEIDLNTFVFVSQETAGVVSALEWMGLPDAQQIPGEGSDQRYMGRLFTLPLRKLMRAGAGVCLLDDYLNAARQIQDVGLSLVDRRRFGQLNLSQTYFGVTGNLGSLDDTNATRASAALRNRMRMYLAHDTVENFINRLRDDKRLHDEMGDGFVRMFLYRYKELFSEHPARGEQGGYTTPRSLRDFVDEVRDCLHRHGGRKGAMAAREEIVSIARSTLGLKNGEAFNAFLEAILTKADPLAREIILEGKLNKEEIDKCFQPGGFSSKDQNFAYQFGMALVDYTVSKVLKDDKLDEAIARFAKGVAILPEDVLAFTLDELQAKLSAQVRTVEKGKEQVSRPPAKEGGRPTLTSPITEKIGRIIMIEGKINSTARDTLISVLSGMHLHDQRARVATSSRTRKPASP